MSNRVTVIITCHGQARDLPIMLMCLDQQRVNLEGKHSVTGDPVYYSMGEYCTHERETIAAYDGILGDEENFRDIARRLAGADQCVFVLKEKTKNVGHHTRGPGIEAAQGSWIVLTNADNYFVSGWLDRLVTNITPEMGLIFWDCVHNGWKWSDKSGDGKAHGCQLKRGYIDLSCVAVKAEIAKKVGFPFRDYEGDYKYIAACARECDQLGLAIGHIPEILLVHN